MTAPRFVPSHLRAVDAVANPVERDRIGDRRHALEWSRNFTVKQYERLQAGFDARFNSDPWELVFLEEWICCYRRTSGVCVYEVEVVTKGKAYSTGAVYMNADPSHVRMGTEAGLEQLVELMQGLADGSLHKSQKADLRTAAKPNKEPRAARFVRAVAEDEDE
jgi:hypothetical protein